MKDKDASGLELLRIDLQIPRDTLLGVVGIDEAESQPVRKKRGHCKTVPNVPFCGDQIMCP